MWTALGDRAIRFPRPASVSPRAIVQAARTWPGVVDVVVASHDVAVYFASTPAVSPELIAALASTPDDATPPRSISLPAVYDGPDLPSVAHATSLTVSQVIELHASTLYTVDTLGFAPGFAYMTGLPAPLHLPRRSTPRTRVPAGSLAIAAGYTAVYPFDSPGGWHLLGRISGPPMFGPDGALLRLGDHVRFTP